jgi:hypothetical protein
MSYPSRETTANHSVFSAAARRNLTKPNLFRENAKTIVVAPHKTTVDFCETREGAMTFVIGGHQAGPRTTTRATNGALKPNIRQDRAAVWMIPSNFQAAP